MTTFSRIVDEVVVVEFTRSHLRATAASYLNQTIRDVHFKPGKRNAVLFGENLFEEEVVVDTVPFIWTVPSVPRFQQIEAIYAPVPGLYLEERAVRIARDWGDNPIDRYYWYRSGSNIVMNGLAVGQTVQVAYYQYPRQLIYYPNNGGPAIWNPDTESFEPNDPAKIELVTNWVIQRYGELIKEGLRAKLYRRLDNEVQARMAWSEFEATRDVIHSSEGV